MGVAVLGVAVGVAVFADEAGRRNTEIQSIFIIIIIIVIIIITTPLSRLLFNPSFDQYYLKVKYCS